MNLIERYIFGRAARLTIVTLLATTVIVMITQVLLRINLLTASGQSLLTFGKLALMLVPSMAVVTLPFALLIGALQVLTQMNSDSELSVLEGAGNSPAATARPIVLLGVLASLANLVTINMIEPWSNRELRNIVATASADLVRLAVQSGSFKKIEDNLYIQVAEERAGGGFGGLFIADLRDPKSELLYYARQADIVTEDDNTLLLMSDGEIHRKEPATGNVSVIRFASYAVDFAQFGAANKAVTYFPKERDTAFLIDPPQEDHFTIKRPDLIRGELNRRFSEWLYPLAFALICAYAAAGARSNRQERMWTLAGATLLALVVRGGGFFFNNLSGSNQAMAFATYALPTGVIVVFAGLILSGRQLRVPQALVERAAAFVVALENRRLALQLRMSGYRAKDAGGGA